MPARSLKNIILSIFTVVAMLTSTPATADALDNALRQGLVGETTRGYVAPVKRPSAAINNLVNNINSRRRAAYKSIAQKNGLSLQKVESVAGTRVIQRAPKGTYYKDNRGKWRRK